MTGLTTCKTTPGSCHSSSEHHSSLELLNVLTSKQEPSKSEMLSENAPPISSQLSCNTNNYQNKSRRKMNPLPPMELPSPQLCHFLSGGCGLQTDEGVPAAACDLLSPPILLVSDPAQPPPAFSTAALRYCSLLHKHSCYDLSLSLSIKVPTSLAIIVRHRLFDAKLAD